MDSANKDLLHVHDPIFASRQEGNTTLIHGSKGAAAFGSSTMNVSPLNYIISAKEDSILCMSDINKESVTTMMEIINTKYIQPHWVMKCFSLNESNTIATYRNIQKQKTS